MIGRTNATVIGYELSIFRYMSSLDNIFKNTDANAQTYQHDTFDASVPNCTRVYRLFYSNNFIKKVILRDIESRMTFLQEVCSMCNSVDTIEIYGDISGLTSLSNLAPQCPSMTTVKLPQGQLRCDLKLLTNPNITRDSLTNVLASLYNFRSNGDNSTTRTLTLNSITKTLLTAAEIADATSKGWTIA